MLTARKAALKICRVCQLMKHFSCMAFLHLRLAFRPRSSLDISHQFSAETDSSKKQNRYMNRHEQSAPRHLRICKGAYFLPFTTIPQSLVHKAGFLLVFVYGLLMSSIWRKLMPTKYKT